MPRYNVEGMRYNRTTQGAMLSMSIYWPFSRLGLHILSCKEQQNKLERLRPEMDMPNLHSPLIRKYAPVPHVI